MLDVVDAARVDRVARRRDDGRVRGRAGNGICHGVDGRRSVARYEVRRVARLRREASDAPTVRGRVRDAAALSPERARVVEAQKALAAAQKAGIPHVYRHVAVRRPDVDADEGSAARGVEVRAELVGERRRPVFLAVSLVREPRCLHAIDETSRPPQPR